MAVPLIAAACAQNPVIRSEVKEVVVPVVVTNGKGQYVPGLKVSDFEVFEDGRPERIVAFRSEIEQSGAAISSRLNDAAKPAAAPDDPRRTYLVIIDTLHSSFANFGRVREALAKVFEKEKSGDAQYAVIALGREPKVVQDSTRDASQVLKTVEASGFSKAILNSEAVNAAVAADQFAALMREYCTSCRCTIAANSTDDARCPDVKSRVQAFLTSFGERTFLMNEEFLRELAKIVAAIASMPTARTVIFISDGFNRFPGRELYGILMGYGPRDRTFGLNPRDTQPQIDAVLKMATANNVRFYTIDSRGLYTTAAVAGSGFDASSSSSIHTQMDSRTSPNISAGVPEGVTSRTSSAARENTDTLALLARETGGRFFDNSNDLVKGVRQAIADGREYYSLSYVSDNALMDGSYRKIQVTVKGNKWQVHAKPGYWADR